MRKMVLEISVVTDDGREFRWHTDAFEVGNRSMYESDKGLPSLTRSSEQWHFRGEPVTWVEIRPVIVEVND